ncbi:MAG: hypothetical protein ACR2PG_05215 [Hyphomicrobiaceae bacterium]
MTSLLCLPIKAAALFVLIWQVSLVLPSASAEAQGFDALRGAWRGTGQLRLASGRTERLRCRAYYNPKESGRRLGMAVRCASSSYKFELRSKLTAKGNRVSGTWEERSFNASGRAFGSLRPGRLALTATGSIRASLLVSFSRNRQTVRLSSATGEFRRLVLTLRK